MESDAELRRELMYAVAKVRRQIDYQSSMPSYHALGPVTGKQIALEALQAELAQLEEALANLGATDA